MDMNLQSHYRDFQSIDDLDLKIKYLKDNIDDLSTYNINIPNLIQSWETNSWPWNRPKQLGESETV